MRLNTTISKGILSLVAFGGVLVVGCSSTNGTSGTSATTSALSQSTATSDGGVPANVAPCLTTYVECVRAGDTADACEKDLHVCLRPPRPDGDGGPMGPGCGGGGGPGGEGPHGPPPGLDGGAPPPPPPDLDDDGGLPPPPPLLPDGGVAPGPFACFADLRTCAQGTDAVDTCVSDAITCLSAFPPPPPPPDGHGPGGGGGGPGGPGGGPGGGGH